MLQKTNQLALSSAVAMHLEVMHRRQLRQQAAWQGSNRVPRQNRHLEPVVVGQVPQVHVVNGKPHTVMIKMATWMNKPSVKYTGEDLRQLRAERGVGKVKR